MTVGESYVKDLINTSYNYLVPEDVQDALASFSVPDVFGLFGGEQYKSCKRLIDDIIAQSGDDECLNAAAQSFIEVAQTCSLSVFKALLRIGINDIILIRHAFIISSGLIFSGLGMIPSRHH